MLQYMHYALQTERRERTQKVHDSLNQKTFLLKVGLCKNDERKSL